MFGSGRREGVLTVLALMGLALAVHALGGYVGLADGSEGDRRLCAAMATAHELVRAGELPIWDPAGAGAPLGTRGAPLFYPPWWLLGRGSDALWLPVLAAVHAALACALAFRFLRAQGRSRYAAFLAGAAYGMGAHVGSLSGNLPEVAALAWAPLPLEILLIVVNSEQQRHLSGWLGPALAIPFLTGGTVTASCTAIMVGFWLLRRTLHEPRRASLWLMTIGSAVITGLLTGPLWIGALEQPHAAAPPARWQDLGLPVLRVAGPLLAFLTLLGLLRRQRNAPAERWLPVAATGVFAALLLPYVPSPFPGPAPWQTEPLALLWPTHLALVLLAASGLDDFLDLPLRRRSATAWLLLLAAAFAPLGYLFGAVDQTFHLQVTVLLALAILFAGWRRLGILGFKTVLATAALVWLASATLHEQARAERAPVPLPLLAPTTVGGVPPAPGLEAALPLLPPRAQIVFHLVDAAAVPHGTMLPALPADAPTIVHGLPAGFVHRRDPNARARLVDERATWADYVVEMGEGTGALLVADTFARGWTATVDEQPVPILRAGDSARVVLLGQGSHLVRFAYEPQSLRLGLRAMIAGLVMAIGWTLTSAMRRLQSA